MSSYVKMNLKLMWWVLACQKKPCTDVQMDSCTHVYEPRSSAHTYTHTTTCVHSLNVCSCGRGWLILSNSMATLHLPTGTLVFNYQRFIPLAPLLRIATSTDKLMEHLITVLLTAVCAVFSEIRMRKYNIFTTLHVISFFSAAQLLSEII